MSDEARDGKYGAITAEHGDFWPEEPLFLLRAQDPIAPEVIDEYAMLCRSAGCAPEHVSAVIRQGDAMRTWQKANPWLVKKRPGPQSKSGA